jgi:ubiquinone/menaquinone biosynthesis C-methylase UbiE
MTSEIDVDAFVDFEAAGFSRVAHQYHRYLSDITDRVAEPLLDAACVTAGSRVLDVATGPGQVAVRAVARGATVLGIDLSPVMVELARRLHPGIEFRQGDAHQLPLDDASFDAVVANFLIPHLADHERAVAELARVTAPGGRIALSAWDVPQRSPLPGALFLAVHDAGAPLAEGLPIGPPFFRYSDDATFAGLLTGAGFVDADVIDVAFVHRMHSADAFWDALIEGSVRASAQVLGQTRDMQRRIREAFDRRVAEFDDGTGLELPVAVKIASGRKP